jgi:hypothetical protein
VAGDAVPQPRWTEKQIGRWDVWALLVVPMTIFWSMVLLTDPTLETVGAATIGTLALGVAYLCRNKARLHRGEHW